MPRGVYDIEAANEKRKKTLEAKAARRAAGNSEIEKPAVTLDRLEKEYEVLSESVARAEENFRLASAAKRELFDQIQKLKKLVFFEKFLFDPDRLY